MIGNPGGDPGRVWNRDHHRQSQDRAGLSGKSTPQTWPLRRRTTASPKVQREPGGYVWAIFNVDNNNPDPSTCFVRYNGFASFKELWKMIEDNPAAFHLSVHNFEHADFGAIRGQLTLLSK